MEEVKRLRFPGGALGLIAALLGACAHYTPHPRPAARVAVDFTQRTLSDPQLRARLDRQLPARAWPRSQWDRADLLVAMLYFNDGLAAGRAGARVASAGTRTAREHPNPTVTLMSEYANQHDGSPLWLWAVVTDWLLDAGAKVRDALQDEQQLHDARRRASLARSALAVTVGVPVKALESLKLGWEHLDDPPAFDALLLERARDDALLARADVHGAVVAYSMAEQALRLEVARQYPDVHLGPAYTWDHGIRRYQFNLGLTLPLLNRNAGAIGEAEARREEAGARLEATVALAWQEIDEAIRQWGLARARLTEARGPVYDAARHIYAQTVRGFEAGANDRTELVAARVAQTLAELQVLDSLRTAQDALAALEDALRRPLEGPELTLTATLASPPVSNDGVTR
ncbi:MAG: TolC family protein [Gammaproteobacteria bacterium]|nr:MAG: TolC family protein [Gammaproteobacteria bacterium]